MHAPDDVRWLRDSTVGQADVAVAATDSAFVEQDARRIALLISAPLSSTLWLSWKKAAVVGQGIAITAGGGPLILNLRRDGAIVQGPIRAIMAAGPVTVSFVEVMAPIG